MIRRTFQLIRGVGPSRERDLWARGIAQWDDFHAELARKNVVLSARQDPGAEAALWQAEEALARRDLAALAGLLPPREHWRLLREFEPEAVYFDIETDGRTRAAPTVVSLFHAGGHEVFILGRNLALLPEAMARFPLWVSFNGSVFDVPALKAYFGAFPAPAAHVDLRFFCRRFGLRGGLKHLEQTLGFGRPPHLCGVSGLEAVLLWREIQATGDVAALRLLVEYNLYDSIQLKTLAARAHNRALEALGVDGAPMPVFDRGDVLYDVTRTLLALGPEGRERDVFPGRR